MFKVPRRVHIALKEQKPSNDRQLSQREQIHPVGPVMPSPNCPASWESVLNKDDIFNECKICKKDLYELQLKDDKIFVKCNGCCTYETDKNLINYFLSKDYKNEEHFTNC